MAGTANDFQNGAPFYLDATQQDLLLAALASNNQNPNDIFSAGLNSKGAVGNSQFQYPTDHVDPTFFTSPQQNTPANAFSNGGMEESPYIDYLDGDGYEFDNADDDMMIGSLPGDSPSGKNGEDSNEKRKNPDDDDDDEEGGGKRREGEDKQAKKPGRKPLTSEPTTVGFTCGVCWAKQLTQHRSARHRTGPPNEPSESGKRSISRILKPRSRSSRRRQTLPTMKTAFFVARSHGCRWNSASTASAYRLTAAVLTAHRLWLRASAPC
jgi:hypothetical protein